MFSEIGYLFSEYFDGLGFSIITLGHWALSLLHENPFLAMVSKSLKRSSGSLKSMSPPHAALIDDLCSSNNPP